MFRDFFNSLSQDRTLVQFIQATLIRSTHRDADWFAKRPRWQGAMSLSLLKFVGQASLVDDAMLPS